MEVVESLYEEPDDEQVASFGALEFHDVFKLYGAGSAQTVALRGLDLRVEHSELVAVLGPSGSGKTTMLHLAAGLDVASAGDVRAGGRSLALLDDDELADYRGRDIAIVFQRGNLWPSLTVHENIDLSLRLARRDDDADRFLREFGLAGRERQRAGSLSGGEQQRVAVAAAAARGAGLVLADEPTAELDSISEGVVIEALARLRDEYGSAVVVVTHSERVAGAVDRVVELRDGRAV